MTTILLKNILDELEDLPDDIKLNYSEDIQKIRMLIQNLINSIRSSRSLSKSISTSNKSSSINIFNSVQANTPIETQLNELKSEMLETLKKNKGSVEIDHKKMS
ncbi:MAG: hypothetical protein ACTSXK_11440 [Promethearchaeota archaeon]